VDRDGPDARMLLLKGVDERGFVFYTNLESPKAQALRNDPRVARPAFAKRRLARVVRSRRFCARRNSDEQTTARPREQRRHRLGLATAGVGLIFPLLSWAALVVNAYYEKDLRGHHWFPPADCQL
jgi:hypothetical protein